MPVEEQGASSRTASNSSSGWYFEQIGLDDLRRQAEPLEILRQPRQPVLRGVDGGDFGAGKDQLGGLAAGRGAEIGDAQVP